MNEQEQYLFDLQGYLVVPNALNADQLAALNAILNTHQAEEMPPDAPMQRFKQILRWGQPYLDLLDNPTVYKHLKELLGGGFRLDHEYSDIIRQGKGPVGTFLHGGAVPFDPSSYYRFEGGKPRSGLLAVAYNLRDVNPGDGGFGCVPGSHKSNLYFPTEWLELETPPPCVVPVTGPAGTAILFTEALTHGTLPWRGQHERRTVFYKYSPAPISWSRFYFNADEYGDLTQRQRDLLQPPNAR